MCLVGKEDRWGKRFVTEVTLIYSSPCTDGINVSRDVTFPHRLKRLMWAFILSCLIVCWISYDKQTRVVVGEEGGWGAVDVNALHYSGPLYHQIQMLLQITSLSTSEV